MGSPRFQYYWDDSVSRYRDARGRFVAWSTIERVMNERIDDAISEGQKYLLALVERGASLDAWQVAFAVELRRAHTQMLALGRGGWQHVTSREWGKLGYVLKQEYRMLNDFAIEIASGNLSEAQIKARMAQYSQKIWNSYWVGQTAAKQQSGFGEERRVLEPTAKHCDDCIRLAALVWQPIGSLPEPGDGSTECLSNDRCRKEYR